MQEQLRNVLSALRAGRLPFRWRPITPEQRKLVSIILTIAITASAALVAAVPMVTSASDTDVLANGSFEQGFVNVPGCGIVGAGWNCFTNGGGANYGFYDDQWEPVVADGKHSQLIEINGKGLMAPDHDRYAGLSQTVRVAPWGKYTFTNARHGTRPNTSKATRGDVAWKSALGEGSKRTGGNGQLDWRGHQHLPLRPSGTRIFQRVPHHFVTRRLSRSLCAVWRKWGVPNEELDVNLDGIALIGPSVGGTGGKEKPALFDWAKPQPNRSLPW